MHSLPCIRTDQEVIGAAIPAVRPMVPIIAPSERCEVFR